MSFVFAWTISENEAPLPTPKNIDFDGLVRLAKNIEIFPYQPYSNTEITKLLNMEGHKEGILTLAPTRTISDSVANKILKLNVIFDSHITSTNGKIYFQNGVYQNTSFTLYEDGVANPKIGAGTPTVNEQTSVSATYASNYTYEIESDLQNSDLKDIRIVGDFYNKIIHSQPISSSYAPAGKTDGGYSNSGTLQVLGQATNVRVKLLGRKDGVYELIQDNAVLPFELADTTYDKIKIEVIYNIIATISLTTTSTRAIRSTNGINNLSHDIVGDYTDEDIKALQDSQILIPSHNGGVLQLSIEVKSASGQWLEHVSAATLAELIADSNGRAILSPEKLNGAILPSTSDSLRVKMITTGNVETGVSVLLS